MEESNRVNKNPEVGCLSSQGTRPTEYAHILGCQYRC